MEVAALVIFLGVILFLLIAVLRTKKERYRRRELGLPIELSFVGDLVKEIGVLKPAVGQAMMGTIGCLILGAVLLFIGATFLMIIWKMIRWAWS